MSTMKFTWSGTGGDRATAAAATLRNDFALTAKLRQLDSSTATGADVLTIVNQFLQPLRDRLEADFKEASAAAEEAAAKQPAAPEEGTAAASAPTSESALRKKAEALDVELRVQIFAAAAVEGQTTLPVMPVRSGQQLSAYAAALAVAPGFTRSSAGGRGGGQCCLHLMVSELSRTATTTPVVEAGQGVSSNHANTSRVGGTSSAAELLMELRTQHAGNKPAMVNSLGEMLYPKVINNVGINLAPKVTGMILEQNIEEVAEHVFDPDSLREVCQEGVDVLEMVGGWKKL